MYALLASADGDVFRVKAGQIGAPQRRLKRTRSSAPRSDLQKDVRLRPGDFYLYI